MERYEQKTNDWTEVHPPRTHLHTHAQTHNPVDKDQTLWIEHFGSSQHLKADKNDLCSLSQEFFWCALMSLTDLILSKVSEILQLVSSLFTACSQLVSLPHAFNVCLCCTLSTSVSAACFQRVSLLHALNVFLYCTLSTFVSSARFQRLSLPHAFEVCLLRTLSKFVSSARFVSSTRFQRLSLLHAFNVCLCCTLSTCVADTSI